MKKQKLPPTPRFNIGDIIGTDARANQWGNAWYEDGSKIVNIEFKHIPYNYTSSGDWKPEQQLQIFYTLEDGREINENDVSSLTGYLFWSSNQRW